MYIPSGVIVPTVELPPVIPATLQITVKFVVFLTAALNCFVVPINTEAAAGVTVTVMEGGGGGGGATELAPPPPQLSVHALTVRSPLKNKMEIVERPRLDRTACGPRMVYRDAGTGPQIELVQLRQDLTKIALPLSLKKSKVHP